MDKKSNENDEKKDTLIKTMKVALAGGAAAVSTGDPTLGIIASLLVTSVYEVLPNFREKNQEKFINQLGIELGKLKEEIDTEFIKKEEFAYLLNKCFRSALEEIDDTKIRAYINILTYSARKPEEFKQVDFYLHILQSLSSLEVHTLAFFNNPSGYLEFRDIDEKSVSGGMDSVLRFTFPELTRDEFRMVLKSLFNRGLTNTDSNILGTITSTSGLRLAEGRLSEAGKKLIKYSSDHKNQL